MAEIETTYHICPVCNGPCTRSADGYVGKINCMRCGRYQVDRSALEALVKLSIQRDQFKRAVTSGWIREHQDELLKEELLANSLKLRPLRVGEKAEKLFQCIARNYGVGDSFRYLPASYQNAWVSLENELPSLINDETGTQFNHKEFPDLKELLLLMGASYAESFFELHFLLVDYLITEKRYLIIDEQFSVKVSPTGWTHVESGGRVSDADSAFVAMWFDEKMTSFWQNGIRVGIVKAGYEPIRIDEQHHSNKIDDEIIAAIRRTKFVVADFTGQRGGVYFEAGFALGLGQKVVWLCAKAELEKVHFDTRQYNFLTWEEGKWEEIAHALSLRIESIFGKGSYIERQRAV